MPPLPLPPIRVNKLRCKNKLGNLRLIKMKIAIYTNYTTHREWPTDAYSETSLYSAASFLVIPDKTPDQTYVLRIFSFFFLFGILYMPAYFNKCTATTDLAWQNVSETVCIWYGVWKLHGKDYLLKKQLCFLFLSRARSGFFFNKTYVPSLTPPPWKTNRVNYLHSIFMFIYTAGSICYIGQLYWMYTCHLL